MFSWRKAAGLLLVGLFVTAPVRADRVPSRKVQLAPQTGAKPQIAVPYTTNGSGNLGVYQRVSPRIYNSPIVDDPKNPQARPVYNLPFYGAVQSFGDRSNGAVPRETKPYAR